MGQTWEDLLFAHWRVPAAGLRPHVPAGLEIEEHDGSAWLGLVPFRLSGLRARGALPLPGLSSFRELNVRTYVRGPDGRPGVWFFSLDATSRAAVAAARRLYRLPYHHARMTLARAGGRFAVECARLGVHGAVFSARYRPVGEAFHAPPGSLEWFLAERYCLYAADAAGRLHRADVHHRPWPLQAAEAEVELASLAPVELDGEPLCHYSACQDVLVWPVERLPAAA
jgi:uncharacterized protein YqjF (DUF2071 family)